MNPIEWYGRERLAEIERELTRRLNAASIVVLNRARTLISHAGSWNVKRVQEHVAGLTPTARVEFAKQFNRNRAYANIRKSSYWIRMKHDGSLVVGRKRTVRRPNP